MPKLKFLQHDEQEGCYSARWDYVRIYPNDTDAVLDGRFTLAQLEEVVSVMREVQQSAREALEQEG